MSAFDKQVEKTETPKDMSLQDILQFINDVYDFCIPEGKEPGESAFNVLDYYQMEQMGAFLKSLQAELARKNAALEAARVALMVSMWDLEFADDGDLIAAYCAGCYVERDDLESGVEGHADACVIAAAVAALSGEAEK